MNLVSLVIPAFNEEANVEALVKRVNEVFENSSFKLECIFVDDGSSDGTYEQIKKVAENSEISSSGRCSIKGIHFSRNFGKEAAILAGLEHSEGSYVAIIDADLQQDPQYVLDMLDVLENNEDIDIVACYQSKRKESRLHSTLKKFFYKIANDISEVNFEENASDFRTMRRSVVEALINMPEYNRFSKGLFAWVGFQTYYMPYDVKERLHGETKWTIQKLFKYAIDGFVGFSSSPLKVATWCGIWLAVAAFIYLIAVVIKRAVYGVEVPGYATIVSLILIIGGIQMICIGIIGEYIGRMFLEVKGRPKYIIKNIVNSIDVERNNEK